MSINEPTDFFDSEIESNTSHNAHIDDIISQRINRRVVLGGSLLLAAEFLALSSEAKTLAKPKKSRLNFVEVPVSTEDTLVVPPGYTAQIFAPWGTPLLMGAAEFAEDASNSAADQAKQIGFNHDGMHYFPLPKLGNHRGLLVMNHEYTDPNMIYSAALGTAITQDEIGREKVAKALAAHGVSIIAVNKRADGNWEIVANDGHNRRITGTTPMLFGGPVTASHPLLISTITPEPKGTLNNCASGVTPWGTYLTCEENWNGCFGTDDPKWAPNELEARYGVNKTGFGHGWHRAESRFDLAKNRSETNHFGWVVEIDPFQPTSTPVKRTALGRIKHESATCTEHNGRVVVYTGDDENGEYLYKFVGHKPWKDLLKQGKSPLDEGILFVAKFFDDGRGEWLPLQFGTGPLTAKNHWVDQADVLIRTRMAADALGATRLHRPEWVAVNADTKDVFVTLTNGSGNKSAVNAHREMNSYGHIVRFREAKNSDTQFAWDIFLLAGDPKIDAKIPAGQTAFGSPDGLLVDKTGLLWIATDISNSVQNVAEKGYGAIGNSSLLVADPGTGELRRFLTGPRGCEITGLTMTPDQQTLFVNVQHPGESSVFWNQKFGAPTPKNPSTVSKWPFGKRPRAATVIISKKNGGKMGQ
jgi:uncharacterized protein